MIVMDQEDTDRRDLALGHILISASICCLSVAKLIGCPGAVWYTLQKIFVAASKAAEDVKSMRLQNNELAGRERIPEHLKFFQN